MLQVHNKTELNRLTEGFSISNASQTEFDLQIEQLNHNRFHLKSSYILTKPDRISYLKHTLIFNSIKQVNYFDKYINWKQNIKMEFVSPFRFLNIELITTTGEYIYLYNQRPFAAKIKHIKNVFHLTIIHDTPSLHPTWDLSSGLKKSTADHQFVSGTKFEANLELLLNKGRLNIAIPSFYPEGKLACFVLTDHCDFDSKEKLKVFLYGNNNNGWLKKGLKITKGVFRYGPESEEMRKSDDLMVSEYKELIDILYEDGSEICPHALKHSGQINSEQFHLGLQYMQENYNSKTWIDHGNYLNYCYSQNGHLNTDYDTLNSLNRYGFNNLWSYQDYPIDPTKSLNLLCDSKNNFINSVKMIIKHSIRGRFYISAHYLRNLVYKSLGNGFFANFLKHLMTQIRVLFIKLKKRKENALKVLIHFWKSLFSFKFENIEGEYHSRLSGKYNFISPFFTENYQTINNKISGLFFFTTIETTHTKDIYKKSLINDLIKEQGLHIGHTYILNRLPYLNGIFSNDRRDLTLSNEWIEFTNVLSDEVRKGRIWNPGMGEFFDRVKLISNVTYHINHGSIKVINNNSSPVKGYTLIGIDGRRLIINLKPKEVFEINL